MRKPDLTACLLEAQEAMDALRACEGHLHIASQRGPHLTAAELLNIKRKVIAIEGELAQLLVYLRSGKAAPC